MRAVDGIIGQVIGIQIDEPAALQHCRAADDIVIYLDGDTAYALRKRKGRIGTHISGAECAAPELGIRIIDPQLLQHSPVGRLEHGIPLVGHSAVLHGPDGVRPVIGAEINQNHIRPDTPHMQMAGPLVAAPGGEQLMLPRQLCHPTAGPGVIDQQFAAEEVDDLPPPCIRHGIDPRPAADVAFVEDAVIRRIIAFQCADRVSQDGKLFASIEVCRFPLGKLLLPYFLRGRRIVHQPHGAGKAELGSLGRETVKGELEGHQVRTRLKGIVAVAAFDGKDDICEAGIVVLLQQNIPKGLRHDLRRILEGSAAEGT